MLLLLTETKILNFFSEIEIKLNLSIRWKMETLKKKTKWKWEMADNWNKYDEIKKL